MTSRLLPPEEWPRLAGTLLERSWPQFDPAMTRVVVVEDGEAIVGCVAMFPVWHVEGAWISPAYRTHVAVLRRGLRALRHLLTGLGVREVLAMATSGGGRRLCERFGSALRLDCEHFAITPKGSTWEH